MIRVLLIDDQRLVGAAVRRLLAADPELELSHCMDPHGALAAALEFSPAVILVDMVMPDVSGLEVVRELRAHTVTARVPLVMLSGEEDSELKAKAFAVGASDYIIKLPPGPEFIARLRSHARAGEAVKALVLDNSFIRETFGRYLSDDVVERLLEAPEGLQLGGERRRVSILMSDLRGFTGMSERLPPEQVVTILNLHLEVMTDIILAYGGTIEELLGDGILVVFGAPIELEDHAQRAVTCAVVMQLAMQRVNDRCRANGLPPVHMGIGVHTGEVVAGNIGSIKRAKYGVIGAAVNLTARIEAFTVGGQILISDATRAAVDAEVVVVDSFQASPKGVAQPITLLDVVGVDGLELPRFDAVLATPVQPLGVTVAVLAGKTHAAAAQPGRLVRVGPMDAELEMEADAGAAATPPAFADVAVELDGVAGRAYAKVLSRRPAGPGVLLRFTDLPDAVAAALAAAAGTTAPASR